MFFTPSIGTIFWMTIIFLLVVYILGKFAWKPILSALEEREKSVAMALENAEMARKEVANLEDDKQKVINETIKAKEQLIKEGVDQRDKIVAESKEKATNEAEKILKSARKKVMLEREAALIEMKNQIAELSVDIATRLVKTELSDQKAQEKLVSDLINNVDLN